MRFALFEVILLMWTTLTFWPKGQNWFLQWPVSGKCIFWTISEFFTFNNFWLVWSRFFPVTFDSESQSKLQIWQSPQRYTDLRLSESHCHNSQIKQNNRTVTNCGRKHKLGKRLNLHRTVMKRTECHFVTVRINDFWQLQGYSRRHFVARKMSSKTYQNTVICHVKTWGSNWFFNPHDQSYLDCKNQGSNL